MCRLCLQIERFHRKRFAMHMVQRLKLMDLAAQPKKPPSLPVLELQRLAASLWAHFFAALQWIAIHLQLLWPLSQRGAPPAGRHQSLSSSQLESSSLPVPFFAPAGDSFGAADRRQVGFTGRIGEKNTERGAAGVPSSSFSIAMDQHAVMPARSKSMADGYTSHLPRYLKFLAGSVKTLESRSRGNSTEMQVRSLSC